MDHDVSRRQPGPTAGSTPTIPTTTFPTVRGPWVEGCGVLGLVVLCVACLMAATDASGGMLTVEGARLWIRCTARSSLVLFLLAYSAQAVAGLWPNRFTARWRALRRSWGRLFVVSHLLHGVGIATLWALDAALFDTLSSLGTRITGGLTYGVIVAMGVTSFDRTAAWISPRAWRVLHTWGSHYVWVSFVVANAKRIPMHAGYAVPVLLLVAVVALRVWQRHRVAILAVPRP